MIQQQHFWRKPRDRLSNIRGDGENANAQRRNEQKESMRRMSERKSRIRVLSIVH
jgi:hypothetical protein